MFTADLHLHSRFARGVSPALDLPTLAHWGRRKGIDLLACGDFTHPAWAHELADNLEPHGDSGLFRLRGTARPLFVLGTEVSCVYRQDGRGRRVHLLLYAPSFDAVARLQAALAPFGALGSDGRPTLRLTARDVVEAALSADPACAVVAAHAWTPWYSVYGSKGGFDSLAECFGDLAGEVRALETGLSSDPSMNWSVEELDAKTLVSFSDAHSAQRLGRELTAFDADLSYGGLVRALAEGGVAWTLEMHPAEGKYHYDGHRKCNVCQAPSVTRERGEQCPVCGRTLTVGVANRIDALAGRVSAVAHSADGWHRDPSGHRPPFRYVVPLTHVLGEALGKGGTTKAVATAYDTLVDDTFGNELAVLLDVPFDDIARTSGERVAEGVARLRRGSFAVTPGYDGEYGKVSLW